MDRLTREEIESVWNDVYRAYEQHTPNIYPEAIVRLRAPFDLALKSLSQEAVRDEALEEAASIDQREVELRGWREAIRALKREPNAAAGQGWIPVSERLPEKSEKYLVWIEDYPMHYWSSRSFNAPDKWLNMDIEETVTHWMPGPLAPGVSDE